MLENEKLYDLDASEIGRWQVFVSGKMESRPDIQFARNKKTGKCQLILKKPPIEPLEGVDWRLGFVFNPHHVGLVGKKAHLRVVLSSDNRIRYSGGSVYMYDGTIAPGVTLLETSPTFSTYEVPVNFNPKSNSLESWIRFTINKPIIGTGIVTIEEIGIAVLNQ
ncbi:MAG: hypothetical protein CL885_00520 [Dehalococcoidia bacterium]|nr:hypothetical protein [Dehalococcoidia bacterium]